MTLADAPTYNPDDPLAWKQYGLCAQTDPDAFFPEKGGTSRPAKQICMGCDVRAQCLQYALKNDERFGIWGGLSERERRRLQRGDRTVLNPKPQYHCIVCNKRLRCLGAKNTPRFCSENCRSEHRARTTPRTCERCRKPAPYGVRGRHVYCSQYCQVAAANTRRRHKPGMRNLTCKHCGSHFQSQKQKRYCSETCRAKRSGGGVPTHSLKPIECIECGAVFQGRGRAQYCTETCQNRHKYRKHLARGRESA